MTGLELSRIFNEAKLRNKKLTKDAFADRIGVGRTKFYDYLKGVPIDEDEAKSIDVHLKGDAELNQLRTLIEVRADKRPVKDNALPDKGHGMLVNAGQSHSPELWEKALNMLNDTLQLLKGTIDTVRDDNKFIKEDAALYRDIVKKGVEEGAVAWGKPNRK